jgi:predicted metal-dependent phosphoesterase TrpH
MKFESLHNHTNLSDGQLTPLELLKAAEQNNFGIIAITEHDVLPGPDVLNQLRKYSGPVKWLIGCEISSGLPKELGGGTASMFHILGLFTDPTDQNLLEHSRKALEARLERMEKLVGNLRQLGLSISAADCLAEAGGESVGRPHIVAALLKHAHNLPVIEALRQQMETAAAHDESTAVDYKEMMRRHDTGQGVAALPFGIFLSDKAFIKDVYVDYSYWTDMDDSVKLIRDAGGVAFIAHWPTIENKIDATLLKKFLTEGRLDGVELATGFVGPATKDKTATLWQLAESTGAATVIGVDGHQAGDIERFVETAGFADQTIGQTQRLIDRFNPDLTYSNFNA